MSRASLLARIERYEAHLQQRTRFGFNFLVFYGADEDYAQRDQFMARMKYSDWSLLIDLSGAPAPARKDLDAIYLMEKTT